jgi:hypothetical protein
MFNALSRRLWIGLWLVGVAIATMLFAVYSLSAFQVQVRIQSFSADGYSYSVWTLDRLRKQQKRIALTLEPLKAQLLNQAKQLETSRAQFFKIENEKRELAAQLWDTNWNITYIIKEKEPKFDFPGAPTNDEVFSILFDKLAEWNLQERAQDFVMTYKKLSAEWSTKNANSKGLEDSIQTLESERKTLSTKIDDTERDTDDLFRGYPKISEPNKNKILDFVSELDVLEDKFGALRLMTQIPNEILTVLVVICMGMLGSTVYLLQRFQSGADIPFSFYVLRQFIGAFTAMMLFIVIKAGVIVSLDPRSIGQSAAELNPFLLAFVGVVGGLISEQVVERISRYGREWLTTSRMGRDRYARGVAEEMKRQNRLTSELASMLGDRRNMLDAWLGEDELIPPDVQAVIAAWLNKPQRDLFSDLPKDSTKSAAS